MFKFIFIVDTKLTRVDDRYVDCAKKRVHGFGRAGYKMRNVYRVDELSFIGLEKVSFFAFFGFENGVIL